MNFSEFKGLGSKQRSEKFNKLLKLAYGFFEDKNRLSLHIMKDKITLKKRIAEIENDMEMKYLKLYETKLKEVEAIKGRLEKKSNSMNKNNREQAKKAANRKYRLKNMDYEERLEDIKQKKLELEEDKVNIMKEAIKSMATLKKKKQPILGLTAAQWATRKKIYPMIIENPTMTDNAIAGKAKVNVHTVRDAKEELVVSGDLLSSKIDLIKRIITRSAMTVEKAQAEVLKRVTENPENIEFKDLVRAVNDNAKLYSIFVGQATDTNGGILKAEDDKMLQEVLSKHLN